MEKFGKKVYMSDTSPIGERIWFKFDNNYGASVIRGAFTYGGDEGLWELAVLDFSEDEVKITYDTEITDDVIGHLSAGDVRDLLNKIEKLEREIA